MIHSPENKSCNGKNESVFSSFAQLEKGNRQK